MAQPTLTDVIQLIYGSLVAAQAAAGVPTEDDVKTQLAADRDAAVTALAQRTNERDTLQAKIDKVKVDVA